MKILLFGEYNRCHYNIKIGLEQLGHKATVASTRDGFKNVDVDIAFKDYFRLFILKKVRNAFIRFLNFDISACLIKRQIKNHKKKLSNYDIVQFINEAPFDFSRKYQKDIFNWIFKWNPKAKFFLLSCGLDYLSVKYAYEKKFRYDILTPYFEGKGSRPDFSPALSYLSHEHIALHKFLYKKIEGVIANDLDYHIPLKKHSKYLGMIPHAINLSALRFKVPQIEDKIVIFHGINTFNYYKKGNNLFEEALKIIYKTHSAKIEVISVKNLPYKSYITSFNKAHILLDQVYAYDQGFNALEAMAKGKVVFTGAEKEWENYFNLKSDTIVINALPNPELIAQKLIWLIDNPKLIPLIAKNARDFVKKHHDHKKCAQMYLKLWNI